MHGPAVRWGTLLEQVINGSAHRGVALDPHGLLRRAADLQNAAVGIGHYDAVGDQVEGSAKQLNPALQPCGLGYHVDGFR